MRHTMARTTFVSFSVFRGQKSPTGPQESGVECDNDATIALLDAWLQEDATDDPGEIRQAEEDLRQFKRNMNAPRKEGGERLLFPDVE